MAEYSWLLPVTVAGVFTVLWWLLRQKDAAQAADIKLLFELHQKDSDKLQELELAIAREHYVKPELDSRFEKLEVAIRESVRELGTKIERMTEALTHQSKGNP